MYTNVLLTSGEIHNEAEYGLWIGLTSHISNHSSFTWLMSRTIDTAGSYSNWNPPVQLPVNPELACVLVYLHMDMKALYWTNVECNRNVRFICESEVMEE